MKRVWKCDFCSEMKIINGLNENNKWFKIREL